MIERIRTVAEAYGPSGAEDGIRTVIQQQLEGLPFEISIDVLGNLIVTNVGDSSQTGPILLTASMDELGLMVIDQDQNGFLRVGAVGTSQATQWVGQRVVFENGTMGIVHAEKTSDGKEVTFAQLYIDLGGSYPDEQPEAIRIGDVAVLQAPVGYLREGKVSGKGLSQRIGCVILLELLHELKDLKQPFIAVFATQHQVGSRGIRPAAFACDPSVALAFGTVATDDTLASKRKHVALGLGPVVMLKERNYIVSSDLRDSIKDVASKHSLAYQLALSSDLVTDAGTVAVSKSGVPTLSLTVPVRYAHTSNELVDVNDLEHTVKLAQEWIRVQR